MDARGREGRERARRMVAMTVGGLAVTVSLVGTTMQQLPSGQAVERIGLYTSVSMLERAANLVLQADIVLLLAVATLISIRLPWNPIGWLLLACGTVLSVTAIAAGYMLVAFDDDPVRLPGAGYVAWIYNWAWGPAFALLAAALLRFPTGRSVSVAWERAFRLLIVALVIAIILNALYPGPLPQTVGIDNPFGLPGLGVIPADWLHSTFFVVVAVLGVGAGSMIVRYRRAAPIEQLQLRWVVGASAFATMTFLVLAIRGPWDDLDDFVFFLVLAAIPLSIGFAIMRYRLYAIDVIIRRTLVYGALSIALAGCYGLTVLVLQPLLSGFVGEDSLVVACATLVVAAVFRPLRSRIQRVIDRRFFRVHYDAARTATELAGRLQGEVELEVIEADLVTTVTKAMRPSRIGFWKRG